MRAHEDHAVVPRHNQAPPTRGRPPVAAESGAPLSRSSLLHLQRTAGNTAVARLLDDQGGGDAISPVTQVVGSGGEPLDAATRTFMESRLGADFGDVRIHTDARASDSARSVQANAYTVGRDVVFQSGHWSPGTDAGRRMLAHELTHVVQQRNGPVDGTPAPGGIRLSDPSDRFERAADESADRVMASDAGVQRQADEEELQASAEPTAQREPADEEEELAG